MYAGVIARDRPHGERQPGAGGRAVRGRGRRRGAAAHPRRLAGEVPGAADALPDRARAPRRGRADGRLRVRRRDGDRPRHEHRLGRTGRGGARARPRRHGHGRRARTRVGRRRGARPGRCSMPRSRASWPAARSPRPASATVPSSELEPAAAALAACGADRYRQEAERELRKLGHGVHRRTRAGKADGTGVETLTGVSSSSPGSSSIAGRTPRSPRRCSSARRRSRRTCGTCSASSASRRASSSHARSSRPSALSRGRAGTFSGRTKSPVERGLPSS